MSKQPASNIVDISAQPQNLEAWRFLGAAGAVTITGYLVDEVGNQSSGLFTLAVDAVGGTAKGFAQAVVNSTSVALTTEQIANATGACCLITGDVYFSLCASNATYQAEFEASAASFPQLPALTPYYNTFGRVGI